MQKHKKCKQMKSINNPLPQSYISSVTDVFVHPSQLLYILIDTEGCLRVFDIPTMSVLNKSYIKFENGYRVLRCMFSKSETGLFYTLCGREIDTNNSQNQYTKTRKRYQYRLKMHYVSKKGQIISNTCTVDLNDNEQSYMDIQAQINAQIRSKDLKKSINMQQNKSQNQNKKQFQQQMQEINALDQRQKQEDIIKQLEMLENQQIYEPIQPIQQKVQNEQNVQIQKAKQQRYFDNVMIISERNQSEESMQKRHVNQAQQNLGKDKIMQQMQMQLPQMIQSPRNSQHNIFVQPEYNAYNNTPFTILQISTYAKNTSKKAIPHLSLQDIQFTMLSQGGFYFCNLCDKLKFFQLGMRLITGVNIYGNLDYCKQAEQYQINAGEQLHAAGSQYGDLWIIFNQYSCFLIQLPSNSNHNPNPQSQYSQQNYLSPKIYSQLAVQIHPCYKNYNNTTQPQQKQYKSYTKFNDLATNNITYDNKKKICLVLTAQMQICIINFCKFQLSIIGKIKLNNLNLNLNGNINSNLNNQSNSSIISLINFIGISRFQVNTNTSNKYQNRFMVFLAINNIINLANIQAQKEKQKQKQKQKQREKQKQKDMFLIQMQNKPKQQKQKQKQIKKVRQKQLKPTCNVYVYSFDINTQPPHGLPPGLMTNYLNYQKPQNNQPNEQLVTVFKDFPQVQKTWYSSYLQNKLNYLNLENNVQMIDLCRLLDGKNTGKQWVNLGYRFQALETNQLYEQLQDQFQLTAEQSKDSGHNVDNGINLMNLMTGLTVKFPGKLSSAEDLSGLTASISDQDTILQSIQL